MSWMFGILICLIMTVTYKTSFCLTEALLGLLVSFELDKDWIEFGMKSERQYVIYYNIWVLMSE